ncbi:MAG: Smr/MutS family protein [Syntrophales bacterium]
MTNDSDSPLKHSPFGELRRHLKDRALPRAIPGSEAEKKSAPSGEATSDAGAFRDAMHGVKPIAADKYERKTGGAGQPARGTRVEPEADVTACLENLIRSGEGFVVSSTPEYMEGTGADIPPEFAERLHRGDFSLQAHVDLHGMGVAEAREAVEAFLTGAIMSGKRAVLIVHGRGLSSPGEPVLKHKVREWLTRTSWRKWVIAFTSAQSYDGGAGATYVLLRSRPAPKKPANRRCP